MFIKKQQLLSLKEENLKFTENFDKFLKKHEANKKFISKNHIKDFMEEQKTLMGSINQQIDEIISNDEDKQTADGKLHQKRKRSKNETRSLPKKHSLELSVEVNQLSDKIIANDEDEIQQKQTADTLPQKRTRSLTGEASKASKKHCKEPDNIIKTYLQKLIEIPGLQHLAENIFLNLSYKDLMSCILINHSSKSLLDNPRFWIKKFIQKGLSRQNQLDWMNAIQITRNTDFERNISFYLKKILKKEKLKDLPCFIDESVLENFRLKYGHVDYCGDEDDEIIAGHVQVMAPIVNDDLIVNGTYSNTRVSIVKRTAIMYNLASKGNIKQIQALIPFLDNPNDPFESDSLDEETQWRSTPIWIALSMGHLEIVKYLVPFANLNATRLQYLNESARLFIQHDVVKYLQSLMKSK